MACGSCAARRRRMYEELRAGRHKEAIRQAARGVRQILTGPTEEDLKELGLSNGDGSELNKDPS